MLTERIGVDSYEVKYRIYKKYWSQLSAFWRKTLSDLESLHSIYHMDINEMPIAKILLKNEF